MHYVIASDAFLSNASVIILDHKANVNTFFYFFVKK